jgi:hypothetical protein
MSKPILSQSKGNDTSICTFCSAEAMSYQGVMIQPSMCPLHYDLMVLVEFMEGHNEPVTLENVQARLAWALSNGGDWVVTAEQLPELLSGFLQTREEQKNGQRTAQHADHSQHASALGGDQ